MDVHEKAEVIKIMSKGPIIQALRDDFYSPALANQLAEDPRNWRRHEWDMYAAYINLDKCGYEIVRKEKLEKRVKSTTD